MPEPVKGPEQPRRYEPSEVSVKQLFGFAAGVVGLVLVGVLGSIVVFHLFVHHTPMGPPASPFDDTRELPPKVRLQTAAPEDLNRYRDEQNKILSEYGWVDPKAGIVRIPVDRAMELLLQKGYPVRASSPVEGSPAKTPKSAAPPVNRPGAASPAGPGGTP
jgi:cytoskeletal protein RodZ